MKRFAVDIATRQFSKKNEDICGDAIKVAYTPDSTIIVMSDGLGSGVKANVLATLTVELASGLFQGDLSLHEIVETLIATLPVCSWRNIAYSTFSLVRIYDTGQVTVAEYDSPGIIVMRNGAGAEVVTGTERTICEKTIRESYFKMRPDDMLMLYSDGIVYAGVGEGLPMGWQEEGILDYVSQVAPSLGNDPWRVTNSVMDQATSYWANRPGDDGTVLCARYRRAKLATLVTGPPSDRSLTPKMLKDFMGSRGTRIVCGGTTSHIVADHLDQELKTDERYLDTDLPPVGKLKGVDLVTEGILTLSRTVEYLKHGVPADKVDAATALIEQLMLADGIKIMVGTARNPAHQNTGLPESIFLRRTVVENLAAQLKARGKETELVYY